MTKADLIDALALQADIGSKMAASRTMEFLIETIKSELVKGNTVDIFGLGKFKTVLQKGKSGKVPGTDKTYTTQDKMVPKFGAAKALKDVVAAGK